MNELILAPKPFAQQTPQEFRDYVRSLFVAPAVREPAAEVTWKLTPKGALSITCRRKPQSITREEIVRIAAEAKRTQAEVWNYCVRRKFLVTETAWPRVRVRK